MNTVATLLLPFAFAIGLTVADVAGAKIAHRSLEIEIQTAAASGYVSVSMKNDVAYLVGVVESPTEARAVEMVALNFPGVRAVISKIDIVDP